MDTDGKTRKFLHARFLRRAAPLTLIALGIWGLAGCFYLPVAEHPVDAMQKDFRPLVRKDDASDVLLRGVTTRATVMALLGAPQYASNDGPAIGYVFDTAEGLYVWPLCFRAVSDRNNSYALRLEFDQMDRLVRFDTYYFIGPPRLLGMPEGSDDDSFRGTGVGWLMRSGPKMSPTNHRIPATQP